MRNEDALSCTRLYRVHAGMKSRCNNPKSTGYKWYGGKGIRVCDEWSGPDGAVQFIAWALTHGYQEGLVIDRIDPDKNYCPENCRWITKSENSSRMERLGKGKYREAYRFIGKHRGEVRVVGYQGQAMEITLLDGSVHLFEPYAGRTQAE